MVRNFAVCAVFSLPLAVLAGCETDDPCARHEAACVDVVLVGKRDDGNGGPIAYRGLSVKVFAPNVPASQSPPGDKCEAMHMYGSELGPVGTLLGETAVPDLLAAASYSPAVQGKLTFQLPDSFNQLPDSPPEDVVDSLPTDDDKLQKLAELRGKDPRALRIIITQSGQQKSAWDSRCDEALFSSDEWLMKKYYRVGQNKYVSVLAFLEGAQTSAP
jgi:hypothetical protein